MKSFSLNSLANRLFSDMELDRKFEIATSCRSVSLGSLESDRAYPIVRAECINTRYGHSVLVAIMDSPTSSVKIFLPRGYGDVVSEEYLEAINSQPVALLLIYKRTCPNLTRTS
jgi:hypothetical protein